MQNELNAGATAGIADETPKPGIANESHSRDAERYAIIIEEARDENEINPVYIGVNGRGYYIKRGEIAEVPVEVLGVLDNAVETRGTPITKEGMVVGMQTRSARRFPYRNYGKVVDGAGNRTNVSLPEGVGA